MKKIILLCILVLVLVFLIGRNTQIKTKQDFTIYQSFCFNANNYKHTEINVIVPTPNYNASEKLDEIREFYDRMNGKSDVLKIRLYDNKENLENGTFRAENTYR